MLSPFHQASSFSASLAQDHGLALRVGLGGLLRINLLGGQGFLDRFLVLGSTLGVACLLQQLPDLLNLGLLLRWLCNLLLVRNLFRNGRFLFFFNLNFLAGLLNLRFLLNALAGLCLRLGLRCFLGNDLLGLLHQLGTDSERLLGLTCVFLARSASAPLDWRWLVPDLKLAGRSNESLLELGLGQEWVLSLEQSFVFVLLLGVDRWLDDGSRGFAKTKLLDFGWQGLLVLRCFLFVLGAKLVQLAA